MEDYDLIVATLQGDDAAFSQLVERYQRPVYNLAYRMLHRPADAEDAAQEVFCRAYTKLHTFDLDQKFSNWILAITSHLCIDHLRRKRAVYLEDTNYASWMSDSQAGPEQRALREEQGAQVRELLQVLPAKYRNVVVLRYWHEMSYAEIAEVTGLALGTVKTRLHRARRMLTEKAATPRYETQFAVQPSHAHSPG